MKEQSRSGSLIVVEGPDASGKRTHTDILVDWLRELEETEIGEEEEEAIMEKMPGEYPKPEAEEKVDDSIREGVWHLSFPTYSQTPGGRIVGAYLDGVLGGRDNLPMERIVDIYAADRKQFRLLMEQYLSAGGIIVCDRYREANLIHQLVGVDEDKWEKKLEWIKSVDEDLPDPDIVFYLDISPEEALERMDQKEKDIHESDENYMRESNRNGRKVANHENWTIIEGERSVEEVNNDLRRKIQPLID